MLLSERHQGLENQRQALKEAFVRCEANSKAVMWDVAQAASQRLLDEIEQKGRPFERLKNTSKLHAYHQKTYADLKAVLRLRENLLELKRAEDKKEQRSRMTSL